MGIYDDIVSFAGAQDPTGAPANVVHPDDARAALRAISERRAAGEHIRAAAMADMEAWVLAADRAEVSRREIARLAGVSRTTIYSILDRQSL